LFDKILFKFYQLKGKIFMTQELKLSDDQCHSVVRSLIKRLDNLLNAGNDYSDVIEELADLVSCGAVGDIPDELVEGSFKQLEDYCNANVAGRDWLYEIFERASEIHEEEMS
jgi:hypothetical protein